MHRLDTDHCMDLLYSNGLAITHERHDFFGSLQLNMTWGREYEPYRSEACAVAAGESRSVHWVARLPDGHQMGWHKVLALYGDTY